MFRDDNQNARACRALLATIRRAELWTPTGPTSEAVMLLEDDGGPLSTGERVMLLIAFAFWNGSGTLRFAEIVESLDVEPCDAVCSLLVAVKYGSRAVDEWLSEHERPPHLEIARGNPSRG